VLPEKTSVNPDADSNVRCAGCGSTKNEADGVYCLDCGKLLSEGYQPLDVIRSSYGLQRKGLIVPTMIDKFSDRLYPENANSVSETAWACVVYSMVPYLGILFLPFAFLSGGIGFYASVRRPNIGGGKLALVSIGLSVAILVIQIFLWWLLYIVPELGLPL
jgi:hypothetical protein